MVRFVVNYPVASVYLLKQDYPHKLMRKCHIREAQLKICPLKYRLMKSQGASYDKLDMAYTI